MPGAEAGFAQSRLALVAVRDAGADGVAHASSLTSGTIVRAVRRAADRMVGPRCVPVGR